ncbi:MAG: type II toxin-antitoxin system YafQ family toxin [Clostridiales Family XIII bacterium]|jgi:mRNA interferase YafQ|nr:type II toxin-antitoxin system YafQ family toxin [Clostridiales Family XIII bacterium]
MRTPVYSNRFKKDYKLCQKRGRSLAKLLAVMSDLENEATLSPLLKEHPLQGDYAGYLECHIEPDWLLIYQIDDEIKEVYFVRTGTHGDLY